MNRRLYRSRTDTMLGGVAAGVASYLNADPALVRIAWAVLVPLTGGLAFVAYIVGWIVIPEEPAGTPMPVADVAPTASAGIADGATAGDAEAADPAAPAPTSAWTPPPEAPRVGGGNPGLWVGLGLILLGVWFLAREYLPDINWAFVWPLTIVAVGVLILVTAARRRG